LRSSAKAPARFFGVKGRLCVSSAPNASRSCDRSSNSEGPSDSVADSAFVSSTIAYIALGANLGDRLATLRDAAKLLAETHTVELLAASSAWDTAPVGPPDQPRYLNAAVAVRTTLGPRALLETLLEIERRFGRVRSGSQWTARTLDLDIIIFGNSTVAEPDLVLPHPRFRERAFVLLPLAEIAPEARDPVTGESVESLLRACPGRSDAVKVGPLIPTT
jgi:2-amino-4-hydroxy-6-hydroxymethyldihydropteridine diphosphokinase